MASTSPTAPPPPLSRDDLRAALALLLPGKDMSLTTLRVMRENLEDHFGLGRASFDGRKDEIDELLKELVEAEATPHEEDEDMGEERADASKSAYNVTFPAPKTARAKDGTPLRAPKSYTQKQIIEAMLSCVEDTQGPRLTALRLKLMCDFREKHKDGEDHDHLAMLADRCFRFNPLKKCLLHKFGLASHWACHHDTYASCIAYGYVPSVKKPLAELDPRPELWAADGAHPPLAEASRPPVTSKALAGKREMQRRLKAEEGKPEPKFEDVDVWPVVIRENIYDTPTAPEILMGYAKRCGGPLMVKFCFRNWPKLPELIARSWKVEKVEDYIAKAERSRMEMLTDARDSPCCCGGRWLTMAREIFEKNGIDEKTWVECVLHSLKNGRGKGTLICHAGHLGNEGKSFLFGPFEVVFGEDGVFVSPPKCGFPLLGLERCRLALLNDWRFNEDLVSYPLQLLWFEGQPIVIARPQNQFSGHLKYSKDDPIFITTLMSDIHKLQGKRIESGDVAMMLKRLKIFEFSHVLANPQAVCPCGHCFACLLLGSAPAPSTPRTSPAASGSAAVPHVSHGVQKRGTVGPTGSTPEKKKPCSQWSVDQVTTYLESLELGHLTSIFRVNAVDGEMLDTLSQAELQSELGLTMLQSRKVINRLPK